MYLDVTISRLFRTVIMVNYDSPPQAENLLMTLECQVWIFKAKYSVKLAPTIVKTEKYCRSTLNTIFCFENPNLTL